MDKSVGIDVSKDKLAFAQRLLDRGLCKMAVISAVMRKLLHLIYGILKSGCPFAPNFHAAS